MFSVPVKAQAMRRWSYLGLLLPIYLIGPGLAYYLDSTNLANVIYWLTGFVVLMYTIETRGMRLEMVRQNEIAIQPLVIAVIGGPDEGRHLVLRNIGQGPALSIRVQDVMLTDVAGDNARFTMRVRTMDYLEPQTERSPVTELLPVSPATHAAYLNAVPSLDPDTAVDTCTLTLTYDDISGRLRRSSMQMGKEGIRLLAHGQVP